MKLYLKNKKIRGELLSLIIFTILMLVFMENMYANILISVLYVFSCFFVLLNIGKIKK